MVNNTNIPPMPTFITCSPLSVATLANQDSNKRLYENTTALFGENSIVGHTLVIHAKEDRFVQPTGDAGSRLVCGIIKRE